MRDGVPERPEFDTDPRSGDILHFGQLPESRHARDVRRSLPQQNTTIAAGQKQCLLDADPSTARVFHRQLVLPPVAACGAIPRKRAKQALRIAALKNLGFVPQDTGWELSLGVKLLFEPDADAVSDAGRQALDQVAHTLTEVGIDRVRVEGHTDNVGTARYNRALSLRRADSVAQQLVKAGWPEDSIERVGHGYDKPVADNATADGRAQNRRVVVTVRVD